MQRMAYEPVVDEDGNPPSRGTGTRSRHIGLAVVAGLIALSAYGGALGLATGFLNLGNTAVARLPFHSPVLGGLALMAVVAVPTTVLAWQAVRGKHRVGDVSIVAGALLAGWILVELAFIRELSFFHPVYFGLGVLLIWLGIRIRRHDPVKGATGRAGE